MDKYLRLQQPEERQLRDLTRNTRSSPRASRQERKRAG